MMRTIEDAIGQRFEPARPVRIVSLVPSLTETLFAYGLDGAVVGVTRYCVEPAAAVAKLPKVGGTKDPDPEALRSLRPDLVIASVEENRKEDVEQLVAAGLRVYVTLPSTVADAVTMLSDLAILVEAEAAAEPMLTEIRAALLETENAKRDIRPLRYFCPIWRRPYMTSGPGTYAHDLLRVAGGTSVCAAGEARYFSVELEEVAAAEPEIILLPDEPYPFAERHKADFAPFSRMPALARGAVHCVDGKALTWYGPRTAAALRTFRELFASVATLRG